MSGPSERLWVKICGLRDLPSALQAAAAGADAIGLNFFSGSPRHLADVGLAREIVAALPETTSAVGVFVNQSVQEIRRLCEATGLTTVQLHGDEPDSMIRDLSGLRVIRAVHTSGQFPREAAARWSRSLELDATPDAWLVDARVPGAYGGTGQTVEWSLLSPAHRQPDWPRLILAGGLTPENVAEAVRLVQPWGVDVASGVESAPGIKNPQRVERFLKACRSPPD